MNKRQPPSADPDRRKAVLVAHLELAFADIVKRAESGCIDQQFSPLGPRRHVAAVKRRWQRGDQGAFIIGRRHILTVDALAEEYFRPTRGLRARGIRRLRGAAPANDQRGAR